MKTDFEKDIGELKEVISSIDDENDRSIIKNAISRYLMDMNGKKKTLIDSLDRGYFEFDKLQLNKLRNMQKPQIEKYLYKILKSHIIIGKPKMKDFPNSLIACSQAKKNIPDYCKGNKLIISKKKLTDIIDILSSDIINPMKSYRVFNTSFITMSINEFRFRVRENETVTIEFV